MNDIKIEKEEPENFRLFFLWIFLYNKGESYDPPLFFYKLLIIS